MTKINSILLILALYAGSTRVVAEGPSSAQDKGGRVGVAVASEAKSADRNGRSFALSASQLALWQEEDLGSAQPIRPSVPAVLLHKPPVKTPPVSSRPIVPVPAGIASPIPTVPAGQAGPLVTVPAWNPNQMAADGDRGSFVLLAKQLALWQENPGSAQPTQPAGPLVLPPKPIVQMPPVPNEPIVPIPVGPASPVPTVPAGPAAPSVAVPARGPNPSAADEKVAPLKDNGSAVPFNLMDPKRETELTVIKGRSQLLRSTLEFARTAVVDPNICDLFQYSITEIGFIGKTIGTTQVTVWFRESNDPNIDAQPRSFVVHVVPDIADKEPRLKQLEAEIARLFPNSKVRLRTFGQRIIVLGQARDVAEAAEILNFVRGEQIDAAGKWVSGPGQAERNDPGTNDTTGGGFPGRGYNNYRGRWNNNNQYDWSDRVMNMLKVPGVHQVMLRVKIAELNRTAARSFGANFSTAIQFRNGSLLLQSLLSASSGNSIIGKFDNDKLNFGIHYLEEHGVVRLLSEPTLVALSGQSANFVAGGEFAVPTVVGVGGASAVTTDFRAYGAIVSFTPYVLDKDLIRLDVSPEFSQIGGQSVGGTPGLTTRAVHTTVELRAGQTLAIAGLLDESMKSDTASDWPWIGKILGPRNVSRAETELIVLVTPELVQPMEPEEVPPMPGFDVTEPDNVRFFLGGEIEGNPTKDYRSTVWPRLQQRYRAGGSPMISGPFGHSNPWAGDPSNSRN